MAQGTFMTVDAVKCLKATAIVMGIKRMPWAFVVVRAQPMRMQMAFATMQMIASVNWTPAAFATDQAPPLHAVATTFLMAIVTVMAINWMPWVTAVVLVLLTWTPMACVMR
jgi:hypothetical protein